MKATFLSQDNRDQPFVMGCYGIGVTRTVAAAIEQNHDKDGIIWPRALAPYDILLQPLALDDEAVVGTTDALEHELTARGYAVLVDDRDAKPGFKFKDADLIGIPLRVTISPRNLPDGKLEVKRRCDDEAQLIASDGAVERIVEIYQSCP
jgi:prolyl-tRNA synthetase